MLVFVVSSNACMVLRVISVEYAKEKKITTNGMFVRKRNINNETKDFNS